MQKLYRYFIDMGVNVVVNGHQHCYSGFEEYNNGLIFYGLGNLFFDKGETRNNGWNEGFILELNFIDNKGHCLYKLHPYQQCISSNTCVEILDKSSEELFFEKINCLNSKILDENEIKTSFYNYCSSQKKNQLAWFSPYSNKYLLALYRRKLLPSFLCGNKKKQIINMLRCESHREVCINCLKEK